MEGKVNGAVKSCAVRLGQLKNLKGGSFDTNACLWMSGLNVVDLARWRELGVSETYQKFYIEQLSGGDESREAIALQASLLTFQDQVYALDDKWALSGLGYDYNINTQAIKNNERGLYQGLVMTKNNERGLYQFMLLTTNGLYQGLVMTTISLLQRTWNIIMRKIILNFNFKI